MKLGGLERMLKYGKRFVVSSLVLGALAIGCSKEESPLVPNENQAPETTIISGPFGEINENFATFLWSGDDAEYFEYRLSPIIDIYEETYETGKTFTDLDNDAYTLYVRAVDNEGLKDPTPAERSFEVNQLFTLILQPGSEGIDAFVGGEFENGEPTSKCDLNFNYDELHVSYGEYYNNTLIQIDRTYIKFEDINLIPPNVDIISATFSLYKKINMWSPQLSIYVSRITNNWGESTVTWNNLPESSSIIEYIENISTMSEGRHYFNITNLMIDWYNGYPNNGVVLNLLEEGENRSAAFYSGDYEDPSKWPKLEINYTLNQ
ncbi:MAG: DNRLRE domain-containing protein [Nanoarchaeota archaeon]|nr:DNRLRE domain-containing protein [Nanoarchaeota archaeon]